MPIKFLPDLGRRTLVMGILNATPDSFSDGGRYDDPLRAQAHAGQLAEEGADIIDIGAESSRPGHVPVDAETELARLTVTLDALDDLEGLPPFSIDTSKSAIAAAALDRGAAMINDIWGLQRDLQMAEVAAQYRVPVVIMHNAEQITREGDIIGRIKRFFDRSLTLADQAGIDRQAIILDPGIGFGKTMPQNLEVLRRLGELKALGFPLLLGTSRKGFIGRILDLPADQRVEGTLATGILGIAAGVDILRVHDVRPHVRAARVADTIVRGLPLPRNIVTPAFLALGSNLGDKAANLADAADRLARSGIGITARSSLWRTEPIGDTDQDWFLNQVLAIETALPPEALLQRCLDIELAMGRIRTRQWGPRLIDIDLLLYGDVRRDTPALTLPHPRMTERAFVLAPLAELAPTLTIDGIPIVTLLARLGHQGCVLYQP